MQNSFCSGSAITVLSHPVRTRDREARPHRDFVIGAQSPHRGDSQVKVHSALSGLRFRYVLEEQRGAA